MDKLAHKFCPSSGLEAEKGLVLSTWFPHIEIPRLPRKLFKISNLNFGICATLSGQSAAVKCANLSPHQYGFQKFAGIKSSTSHARVNARAQPTIADAPFAKDLVQVGQTPAAKPAV